MYSIRIVSYNILAAQYLKTEEAKTIMYPYCPVEVLQSNYRNPLILQELIGNIMIKMIFLLL